MMDWKDKQLRKKIYDKKKWQFNIISIKRKNILASCASNIQNQHPNKEKRKNITTNVWLKEWEEWKLCIPSQIF